MDAYDYIALNDHNHGKLNRGERGYYPTPSSSREEEKRKTTATRKNNLNKAVEMLKKTGN